MAGFAVDIGEEGASFAQPVTIPGASGVGAAAEGLALLGKGVFGVMDAQARASKTSESAINREAYGSLSKTLDDLKGKSPLEVRTGVQSALTTFTNQGFQIDTAVTDLIKLKTGVDVSHLNFDPQQEAINATMDFIEKNPGLIFKAQRDLESSGKPFKQEDIIRTAFAEAQSLQANTAAITAASSGAQVDFDKNLKPQIDLSLDKVRSTALFALEVERRGGNIAPESLVRLRSQLDQVKATFTKPSYVTAEQWQGVQAQFETLDGILTTIENYDQDVINKTNLEIMEPIWGALQGQARELAKTDPLLAKALLDPKLDLSTYVANKWPTFQSSLKNLKIEDSTYTELDFSIFEQSKQVDTTGITTTTLEPAPTAAPVLHDQGEVDKAADRSSTAIKDSFFFGALRANLATPANMADPAQRDNFFAGIGQATVNGSATGELIATATMNTLFSDNFFVSLKEAEKYDPKSAELAKARASDLLRSQANVAITSMSGTFKDSPFKIAGVGKVSFDIDGLKADDIFRVDPEAKDLVKGFAAKWYNGDVTAMIQDRGRKMPTFDREQIRAAGFNIDAYNQEFLKIKKYSETLKYYSDNLRKLGEDPKVFDAMVIKAGAPQESVPNAGSLENPWNIVWSDKTDVDEKLFLSLPVGAYFINKDGDIEQKVR